MRLIRGKDKFHRLRADRAADAFPIAAIWPSDFRDEPRPPRDRGGVPLDRGNRNVTRVRPAIVEKSKIPRYSPPPATGVYDDDTLAI
jgi:hypothetical protein